MRVVSEQAQPLEPQRAQQELEQSARVGAQAQLQQEREGLLAQSALERPERVQQARRQTAQVVASSVLVRELAQALRARGFLAVCDELFRRLRSRSNWSASSSRLRRTPAAGQ